MLRVLFRTCACASAKLNSRFDHTSTLLLQRCHDHAHFSWYCCLVPLRGERFLNTPFFTFSGPFFFFCCGGEQVMYRTMFPQYSPFYVLGPFFFAAAAENRCCTNPPLLPLVRRPQRLYVRLRGLQRLRPPVRLLRAQLRHRDVDRAREQSLGVMVFVEGGGGVFVTGDVI